MGKRFQHDMAQEGAGLSDPRQLMREATDHLEALRIASNEWHNAIIAAGLTTMAWNSNTAFFRHISPSLPGISLGALMTRLDHFTEEQGLAWLGGSQSDLRAFHQEVIALDTIARPLRDAIRQLHKPTIGNRSEPPLSRALSQPRARAALDELVKILGDLSALAPLLKPLPQETWSAPPPEPSAPEWDTAGPVTIPLSPTPDRPLTRLRALVASVAATFTSRIAGGKGSATLGARTDWPLKSHDSRGRLPGNRRLLVMAGILLIMATVTTALTLTHRPQTPVTSTPTAGTPGANASPHATPTSKSTAPATTPTPQPTTPPAPKVTLACVVRGLAATLTITNSGTTSLTWQAKPQGPLNISPTRGTLAKGQSTMARVTADHRKPPTGTITVTATSDGVSTSSSVACQ